MTIKTKTQIINETAKFYGKDTSQRASDGNHCLYLMSDGRKCAVGRCMVKPIKTFMGTVKDIHDTQGWRQVKFSNKLLKLQYRGHSVNFWMDLQKFHDDEHNWFAKGLSQEGKKYKQKLLTKWSRHDNPKV